MLRRQLLKGGVLLSAALLGEALLGDENAEAGGGGGGSLTARFFSGTADNGADISNWTLWLVIVGKRVRGIAFDPANASAPPITGARLAGRLTGHRLHLTIYDIADLAQ